MRNATLACLMLGGVLGVHAFVPFNSALSQPKSMGKRMSTINMMEKATFGAGCFWCVEAVFERLDGVSSVVAGYAGGTKENPTYEEVCTGKTGHAEVAQITFDPAKITYEKLLEMFWKAHDPTTLNRQGADHGTQYRSVIFYHDEKQREAAERSKREAAKEFDDPIVTEIKPLTHFYEAENYHQDYFRNNANAPYCRFVIKPKLEKLKLK
jgi:peptide-methionine (S)-S-oxide reductase